MALLSIVLPWLRCSLPALSGLIAREAVSKGKEMIREAIRSALDDGDAFDRWFGAHVTR